MSTLSNLSKFVSTATVDTVDIDKSVSQDDALSEVRKIWKRKTGRWNADEKERFLDAIRENGISDWQRITRIVGTRTTTQCRTHYQKVCKKPEYKEALRQWKATQVEVSDFVTCDYMGNIYKAQVEAISKEKKAITVRFVCDKTQATYPISQWKDAYMETVTTGQKRKRAKNGPNSSKKSRVIIAPE